MIKITNTPNLLGIAIHGDYEDLKALHIAMSDYLDFYFDHMKEPGAYNCYETILGLCYDIRHAYQGDRNIESIENNAENISQLASLIYEVDEAAIMKERKKIRTGIYISMWKCFTPGRFSICMRLTQSPNPIIRKNGLKTSPIAITSTRQSMTFL